MLDCCYSVPDRDGHLNSDAMGWGLYSSKSTLGARTVSAGACTPIADIRICRWSGGVYAWGWTAVG